MQFRIVMESRDILEGVQVDSLAIEFAAPALARGIVGEISVEDQPASRRRLCRGASGPPHRLPLRRGRRCQGRRPGVRRPAHLHPFPPPVPRAADGRSSRAGLTRQRGRGGVGPDRVLSLRAGRRRRPRTAHRGLRRAGLHPGHVLQRSGAGPGGRRAAPARAGGQRAVGDRYGQAGGSSRSGDRRARSSPRSACNRPS